MRQKITFPDPSQLKEKDQNTKFDRPTDSSDKRMQMIMNYLETTYSEKLLFNIDEVAKITNMSYDFISDKIRKGKILVSRFGDRPQVSVYELARLIREGV